MNPRVDTGRAAFVEAPLRPYFLVATAKFFRNCSNSWASGAPVVINIRLFELSIHIGVDTPIYVGGSMIVAGGIVIAFWQG